MTQQGRRTVPSAESLPNRHHLASQAQMGESTKKERSWFGCILEIMLSLCNTKLIESHGIHEDENYVKIRGIPLSTFIDILKKKSGKDDIHEGNIMSTLYEIFGESASCTVNHLTKLEAAKVKFIDLAEMEALVTDPAEVGKLEEEKEGLEAEIRDIKLKWDQSVD